MRLLLRLAPALLAPALALAQTPGSPAPAPDAPSMAAPPGGPQPHAGDVKDSKKEPSPADSSPFAVLEPVNGTVKAVDLQRHQLVVASDAGEVTLGLDRNTLVYLPTGLATVLALRPGAQIRAARSGDHVAYWVLIRSQPGEADQAQPTPGQGTGPGGGSAPPTEGTTAPPTGSAGTTEGTAGPAAPMGGDGQP